MSRDIEHQQELRRRLLDNKRLEARGIVSELMRIHNGSLRPPATITFRHAIVTIEHFLWIVATDTDMVEDLALPLFQRGIVENNNRWAGQCHDLRDGMIRDELIAGPIRPRGMAA